MSRTSASAILLLTACIWGFAFVAQRAGMEHVGPFTFNAVRFCLGGLVLVPLLAILGGRSLVRGEPGKAWTPGKRLTGGVLAGAILFFGASFQQGGIVFTTAGKAGFITGLYVVIVPLIGLGWRQKTGAAVWAGAGLAVAGLYLLSVRGDFSIGRGDGLVLAGAFFWAVHVQVIGWLVNRVGAIPLACMQFLVCAFLSAVAMLLFEAPAPGAVLDAGIPILYAGLLSTAVAYTLQVVGQRRAKPAPAAIILSLEAVFAALGGWLLLSETLSVRQLAGCAFMLAGMVLTQWPVRKEKMREPKGDVTIP